VTAAQMDLAIIHQIGAVILWVLIIRARHLAQYPVVRSVRKGTV
jgi:cytochrome c oxidase assembly protein subunit 15